MAAGARHDLLKLPPIKTATHLLFDRLPTRIFVPLASKNRQRYWELLCMLHSKRFGPDAPLPPSQGFLAREVTQDIEEELVFQETWEDENETPQGTPLNILASGIFNFLLDTGWFYIDR